MNHKNHKPYDAVFRNNVYGIRRGVPWKQDKRTGQWVATGEHPSEVLPKGKKI